MPNERQKRIKRIGIRAFVLVATLIVAIDTAPFSWKLLLPAKQFLSPALNRTGLWQGEWSLFSPDPEMLNAWLTAEIRDPDSNLALWNSPYWAETTNWEKFYRFRYINFYNRLPFRRQSAIDNFADYLARREIGPKAQLLATTAQAERGDASRSHPHAWTLTLVRDQLDMVLPKDGSLPKREDTISVVSTRFLTSREYLP